MRRTSGWRLSGERHQHSGIARLWFEAASEASFLFLPVHADHRASASYDWLSNGEQCPHDDRIKFAREPEEIELRFRKHSRLTSVSPKVWADAYLMGFAQAAGLTLVTFDRALARKPGKPS